MGLFAPIRSRIMTTRCRMACASLLILVFCSGAPSDDQIPDPNAETVNKVLASLASAFNARDPKAISELFTPKGEFIDADDNVFEGREAIASEFTALFELNSKSTIELEAED